HHRGEQAPEGQGGVGFTHGVQSSVIRSVDRHDDHRVAIVNHISHPDHDLGHGSGHLGQHGDLHLHRLEQHDLVGRLDPVTVSHVDVKHGGDNFGDDCIIHARHRTTRGTKNCRVPSMTDPNAHDPTTWAYAEKFV